MLVVVVGVVLLVTEVDVVVLVVVAVVVEVVGVVGGVLGFGDRRFVVCVVAVVDFGGFRGLISTQTRKIQSKTNTHGRQPTHSTYT